MDLRWVGYDDRDWINLAEDRDRRRAYVRAAMNLRPGELEISFKLSTASSAIFFRDEEEDGRASRRKLEANLQLTWLRTREELFYIKRRESLNIDSELKMAAPFKRFGEARISEIEFQRFIWAGHVARMGESRNAYRVLVGRPKGKRPLGRPRRRWEDNIKMDLREVGYDDRDWFNLDQYRDRWRAYVRAAMNLRVSHFKYLGCDITYDYDKDVNIKTQRFQAVCGTIDKNLKKKTRKETQIKFYKTMATPTPLYGCEAWTLKKNYINRIQSAEMKFLIGVKGCTRLDRYRNDDIRNELNLLPIIDKIKEYRIRWSNHLRRMDKERIPKQGWIINHKGGEILVGQEQGGKLRTEQETLLLHEEKKKKKKKKLLIPTFSKF
ncbi:hypothetical protein ANN_22866 [Periplaneta americana]|uniref:Uncharacterized protein n=1 Tax=Periplaneta americana TaxID=6978 RepID=A0ABQ8SKI1_PERAM|nr:hypothetical protein ANN_22866 [Periplaneta americana]